MNKDTNANVYILTEEGRAYSDEGIQFVLKMLREEMNCNKEITICQGQIYNNIPFLVNELEKPVDSYIIISTEKMIGAIQPEQIKNFIQNLKNYPEASAWEVAREGLHIFYDEQKEKNNE